jgi:hypothetical protein
MTVTYALLSAAFAATVPVQGHVDLDGAPGTQTADITFTLHGPQPGGGVGPRWSDEVPVALSDGDFAVLLEGVDDDLLDDDPLYLSISVSGVSSDLMPIGWVPRARYAAAAGSAARADVADVADTLSVDLDPGLVPDGVAWTTSAQTFADAVTATQFNGSGAGLTGVPASSITGANLSLTGTPSSDTHVVPLGFLNTRLASYLNLTTGGTVQGQVTLRNPGLALHVSPTSGAAIARLERASSGAGDVGLEFAEGGITRWRAYMASGDVQRLAFSGGGANRMVIGANGTVGIGIDDPLSPLHVVGTVRGTTFSGSGAALTDLPASSLVGVVPDGNLPTNLVRSSSANFSSNVTVNGAANLVGGASISAASAGTVLNVSNALTVHTGTGATQLAPGLSFITGTFTAGTNHPSCNLGDWKVPLGDTTSARGFIDIELFGDHRSGSSCGEATYDRWTLSTGDMGTRGARVATSVVPNLRLNIQTSSGAAPYVASSPVGASNFIQLLVPPYSCGCDRSYQYVVRYTPSALTPRTNRNATQ